MYATGTIPLVRSTSGSVTLRILPTSLQIFLCYFAIGLPMAVLPSVVHLQLHFNTVLAGVAISAQYVATVLSRPQAGRMADSVGARRTVLSGLIACAASGRISFKSSANARNVSMSSPSKRHGSLSASPYMFSLGVL